MVDWVSDAILMTSRRACRSQRGGKFGKVSGRPGGAASALHGLPDRNGIKRGANSDPPVPLLHPEV